MKILLILNEPPYGSERSFNGLRLAKALAGKGAEVTVFLMADAVVCAKAGQKVPQGYYNLELMVKSVIRKGEVLLCGTCMDARGLAEVELVEGARPSTMAELAERTLAEVPPSAMLIGDALITPSDGVILSPEDIAVNLRDRLPEPEVVELGRLLEATQEQWMEEWSNDLRSTTGYTLRTRRRAC